jgi:hypothetical protein
MKLSLYFISLMSALLSCDLFSFFVSTITNNTNTTTTTTTNNNNSYFIKEQSNKNHLTNNKDSILCSAISFLKQSSIQKQNPQSVLLYTVIPYRINHTKSI